MSHRFVLVLMLLMALVTAMPAQIPGIGPVEAVVRAQTGLQFTEGPAADLQGNVYFSDVQRNNIHKLDVNGQLTTFLPNAQGMNGLMFDPRGRLIGCQSSAGRIVAIDVDTKEVTPVASQFEGTRFNSPNDLTIDRQGNVYFSDRNGNIVYFVTTDGTVRRLITNLSLPNGLLLALDEKTLYVLHNQATMLAYPVTAPGQLGEPRTIALAGTGGGDGMTIDTQGNLYVTRPNSNAIQVLKPTGEALGTMAFPEAPSNATFGGVDLKTLYVTARTSVYTAKMSAIGFRFATPQIATVNAASYQVDAPLARGAIVAAFGLGLATSTQVGGTLPLPTTLAGTTIKVTDSSGADHRAPLFFVSAGQINYQVPPATATGGATITITTGDGKVFTQGTRIAEVAPGLFAANANGQGVAVGFALRVKADTTQSLELLARLDPATNRFEPAPIRLGNDDEQVYLVLFATGLRNVTALSDVTATLNDTPLTVQYAGPQGEFTGLDQLNLLLPRVCSNCATSLINIRVAGQATNALQIAIREN